MKRLFAFSLLLSASLLLTDAPSRAEELRCVRRPSPNPLAPTSSSSSVVFNVTPKAGAKLKMQSWFYYAQGKKLCDAYYA